MTPTILDPTTYAAVAAAATQTAQIAALIAAWGGGSVSVNAMDGLQVAESTTYAAWVADTSLPRGAALGAFASGIVRRPGVTVTSFVFLRGATPICSVLASDVALDFTTVLTGRFINLADAVQPKLRITANPALPAINTAHALVFTVADGGSVDTDFVLSIANVGTEASDWSIEAPGVVLLSLTSGTTAVGSTTMLTGQSHYAGEYALTLVSAGADITDATQNIFISILG